MYFYVALNVWHREQVFSNGNSKSFDPFKVLNLSLREIPTKIFAYTTFKMQKKVSKFISVNSEKF